MSRISDAKEVILTSDVNGENYSAAMWDPENGSQLFAFKNAGALEYRTLQLLSDSYLLGASVTKSRIHIWPLNSPLPVNNIRLVTPGKVNALTCTPNGSYLIAAVEEKLIVWQTCNGRILANLSRHYQTITCVSSTKDGSLFASAGHDGLVFVWSLYSVLNDEHCSPVHKFSHHNLPIQGLCFGHGGARARLYTISLDGKTNIYELGSGDLLVSLIFNVPLTAIAVNICESELFVGCTNGNILRCNLHNPPRGIEQHVKLSSNTDEESMVLKAHKSNVTALSISVNCRILVSGSTDKAVHVWDIASKQVLRTIEHKGPVTAAFFAMRYDNFRASVLNPRLEVCSLQNDENADKESVIRVISRGRNPAEIIDFESFVGASSVDRSVDAKKLESMQEEIERLKRINATIYQYSVTHILEKIKNA